MATTQVNFRVDQELKTQADRVFDAHEISPTQAVNALYQFVAENNRLPFFIRTEVTESLPAKAVQTALIRKLSVLQLSAFEFYLSVFNNGEVTDYHREKLVTECESFQRSFRHFSLSFTAEDDILQPAWSHVTALVNMLYLLLDSRRGIKNGVMKLDYRDITDGVNQIMEYTEKLRAFLLPDEEPCETFTSQLRAFQKRLADDRRQHSDVPDDSWVLIYYLSLEGWDRTLDRPQSVKPGCVAFDKQGCYRVATGGNDYDGAQYWSPTLEN